MDFTLLSWQIKCTYSSAADNRFKWSQEDYLLFFHTFLSLYREANGKDHPALTMDEIGSVMEELGRISEGEAMQAAADYLDQPDTRKTIARFVAGLQSHEAKEGRYTAQPLQAP